MRYNIITSKKVNKFLKKHPNIISRYISAIEIIEKNPFSTQLDIKKMKGEENAYRLRIGKYRFLYTVEEENILIYFFNAGARGDIYL